MNIKNSKSFSNFLIVWSGQLLSSIGNGLTAFVLGIYVFQKTGSATSYALIILAAFLPSLLLKPIGGALCDRFDRRLMMIIGDLGSAAGLLFILCMMFTGISELWVIYLGVIISSLFAALHNPAYKASVTDLLDDELYSKASGLMQLAESARFIISPIVAGVLLNVMDIGYVLLIDVASFLAAVCTVLWIKKSVKRHESDSHQQHFLADFISGFQYTCSRKSLVSLLFITSLVTFFIGFLQSLLGPMILVFADSKTLGMTTTIAATGMIISSLFIGVFSKTEKKVPMLSFSLILAGIFYALLGVSTNIIFIIVSGFLFFLALPFVNTSLDVLVRKNVDNSMQGRVWSIVSLITQFGYVIAYGSAGFLADHIFNPLFQAEGILASSIGTLIGTGPGRGIGFMFIISGFFVSIIAVIIGKLQILKVLDENMVEGMAC